MSENVVKNPSRVKKILSILGIVIVVLALGVSGFVYSQVRAFDDAMAKVYDVPVPAIARSSDPAVIARGKHLVDGLAGCSSSSCHGADLSAGRTLDMGPLGKMSAPNITPGGIAPAYTDGELARLIQHGLKKDGRSVLFMPSQHFGWLPEKDVQAIVSYVRSVPAVDKPNGPMQPGVMLKVLDRQGAFEGEVASHIDHTKLPQVPDPAPTAEYGRYILKMCAGCHGSTFAGGKIPGAPPSMPIPLNLTPHETGLKGWTYADFEKTLREGLRKNGKTLDPFMPVEAWKNLDDIEMRALWAAVQELPAKPFGER